ncbi:MAG: hypothetical protein AAF517_04975 [Planctomycetota bacterium]
MIDRSIIDEVVGADFSRAPSVAHLIASCRAFVPLAFLLSLDVKFDGEKTQGLTAIRVLISSVDEHFETARLVSSAHGGLRPVLVLSTGTSPTLRRDGYVSRVERLRVALRYRKYNNRDRGGVHAAPAFGRRNPLEAVLPSLGAKGRAHARASKSGRGLRLGKLENLRVEAALFGELEVRGEEITHKQFGVVASFARSNLEKDVGGLVKDGSGSRSPDARSKQAG